MRDWAVVVGGAAASLGLIWWLTNFWVMAVGLFVAVFIDYALRRFIDEYSQWGG